jgi:3-hydroxyisobutyrate dehydrogenase-like beta-hydroxyacid dehydrogenase
MRTTLLTISIVTAVVIAHIATASAGTPTYIVVAKPDSLSKRQTLLNRLAGAGYRLVGSDGRSYVVTTP